MIRLILIILFLLAGALPFLPGILDHIPKPPPVLPADDIFAPPPRDRAAARNDPKRAAVALEALTPALTRDLEAKGLRFGDPVFIRVFKEERLLELWVREPDAEQGRFKLFRHYPIAAMSGKLGPKLAEGDRQAPEGFYSVATPQLHPTSKFHLAFNLGFPNAFDRANRRTGSFIMIHGDRVSSGCFAMTDVWIEEIYTLCQAALRNDQTSFPVHCFPFRMEQARMDAAAGSPNLPFWENLREGYELFEERKSPPKVRVDGTRYAFE